MRTTVTLPESRLAELVDLTGARTKTQAVMIAIEDEIKARKLDRINKLAGTLEFEEADKLRHNDERLG